MGEGGAYSRKEKARAVNLSAVLGWAAVCVWTLGGNIFGTDIIYAAIIGLPIAFAASWGISAPILWRILQRPVGYLRAAGSGAGIAAVMALASIVIGRFMAWTTYQDGSFRSQIGGGDYVQSVNGVLTPYGWQVGFSEQPDPDCHRTVHRSGNPGVDRSGAQNLTSRVGAVGHAPDLWP